MNPVNNKVTITFSNHMGAKAPNADDSFYAILGTEQVDKRVIAVLTTLAKDYFILLGGKVGPSSKATLSLGAGQKAVIELKECDDNRINEIFIKRRDHCHPMLTGVPATEVVFEIKGMGGGLTTGTFRFPHLLRYLFTECESQRISPDTRICIVGPGLAHDGKGSPHSPQFLEIYSLFPKAKFVLLDNDPIALEAMKKQYNNMGLAKYDPLMIRLRTLNRGSIPQFWSPPEYIPLYSCMKDFFVKQAASPATEQMKKMLDGIGQIKEAYIKLPKDQVEVKEFDINASKFEEATAKYDIMVATLSIVNALVEYAERDDKEHIISVMVKFLTALKENGRLIIDMPLFREMIIKKGLLSQIESRLGYKLELKDINYSDFCPNADDEARHEVCSFSLHNAHAIMNKTDSHVFSSLSTYSLKVIIRTGEKLA